ncbi:hypothetical protein QML37_31415, partial [Klebsiella pneumoniae]|uniref:hypothetical protein n=1 Tax=Klebsiella pneumoniae TaxID=573 RepID=UPI003A81089C
MNITNAQFLFHMQTAVDKMKGKQVVQDASTSVNDAAGGDSNTEEQEILTGENYATPEQPLWKEIEVITKPLRGGGNVKFVCSHCMKEFTGSYTRVKAHLLKLPGYGVKACKNMPAYQAQELKSLQEHADEMISQKKTISPGTHSSMPSTAAEKKR